MKVSDLGKSLPANDKGGAIGDVFERFGELFIAETKRNLEEKGKNASFALSQSISYDVKIFGTKYQFSVSMEDYYKEVDEGRKPGSSPPINDILRWMREKPVTLRTNGKRLTRKNNPDPAKEYRKAAFYISKKIGRVGTEGSKFFSDVVTKENLKIFQTELSKAVKREVTITIKDIKDKLK